MRYLDHRMDAEAVPTDCDDGYLQEVVSIRSARPWKKLSFGERYSKHFCPGLQRTSYIFFRKSQPLSIPSFSAFTWRKRELVYVPMVHDLVRTEKIRMYNSTWCSLKTHDGKTKAGSWYYASTTLELCPPRPPWPPSPRIISIVAARGISHHTTLLFQRHAGAALTLSGCSQASAL